MQTPIDTPMHTQCVLELALSIGGCSGYHWESLFQRLNLGPQKLLISEVDSIGTSETVLIREVSYFQIILSIVCQV